MDYTYDPSTGTYTDEDGNEVDRKTILALLATLTAAQAAQFRALAQQRADDELDTAAWHDAMAATVETGVLAATALASGGLAQLGLREVAAATARIGQQLTYLAGFVADIASGAALVTKPELEGGHVGEPTEAAPSFLARAELYGGATHSTFMAAENDQAAARGFEMERNILDDGADNCAECLDATDQEWVPLGTLSLPGERECMANCRCEMDYATADELEGAPA